MRKKKKPIEIFKYTLINNSIMGKLGALKVAIRTGEWKPILGIFLTLGSLGCLIAIIVAFTKKTDMMEKNKPLKDEELKPYAIKYGIMGILLLIFGLLFLFVF